MSLRGRPAGQIQRFLSWRTRRLPAKDQESFGHLLSSSAYLRPALSSSVWSFGRDDRWVGESLRSEEKRWRVDKVGRWPGVGRPLVSLPLASGSSFNLPSPKRQRSCSSFERAIGWKEPVRRDRREIPKAPKIPELADKKITGQRPRILWPSSSQRPLR